MIMLMRKTLIRTVSDKGKRIRVNQFIPQPTEERAQHKIWEISVTLYSRCNISIAVSLRAWCLSHICCTIFCISHRSLRGIGAMIVNTQSG